MDYLETALDVGINAVRLAARLCQTVQAQITDDVLEKKDRSPVTIADFGSQAIICRALQNELGDVTVVGEEDSAELRDGDHSQFLDRICEELSAVDVQSTHEEACRWIDIGNGDPSDKFWTLDPIDGTKGFLRGQQFAISLALIEKGQITVAVLGCPNLSFDSDDQSSSGSLFYAIRGRGAFLTPIVASTDFQFGEGTQVRVSDTHDWHDVRFCESVESGHSAHGRSAQVAQNLGIVKESVRLDSQAKYAVVARGQAEVYLRLPVRRGYEEKIWDHAGGALVVEEAGGTITDIEGRPLDFNQGRTLASNRGVVASNGKCHDGLLAALEATAPVENN
jgi:3'(2'), 5'-bisphosphate nucleotidase